MRRLTWRRISPIVRRRVGAIAEEHYALPCEVVGQRVVFSRYSLLRRSETLRQIIDGSDEVSDSVEPNSDLSLHGKQLSVRREADVAEQPDVARGPLSQLST